MIPQRLIMEKLFYKHFNCTWAVLTNAVFIAVFPVLMPPVIEPEQQQQLLELAAISNATCIVCGLDGDAAVFLEASSEWLPDEPSPSETVFELVCWGLVV